MKIGFLGAGHWHTSMYVRHAQEMGHEITAIQDDNPQRVAELAKHWKTPSVTAPSALLDQGQPDCVFILGPHDRMPSMMDLAIDRSIPFIVEKPAGITAAAVRQRAELCRDRKLFNAVPFSLRWDPGVARIKQYLDEGALGRVANLGLTYFAGPRSRYVNWHSPWVLDVARSGGGCLMNMGVHLLDLVPFFGLPLGSYLGGARSNQIEQTDMEDTCSLLVQAGDVYATIECGYCTLPTYGGYSICLVGEKGYLDYRFGKLHVELAERDPETLDLAMGDSRGVFMKEAFDAIQQGNPFEPNLFTMTKILEITDAFYGRE